MVTEPAMNRTRYYALIALIAALLVIFVVGAIHKGGPAGDVPDEGGHAPSGHAADRHDG